MGNKDPIKSELMAKNKNVIIIGGGDTGCDCIATSLRHVSSIRTVAHFLKIKHFMMLNFFCLRALNLL